jgi:hypothetical protein
MGIDYSYKLIFGKRRLIQVLRALPGIAAPSDDRIEVVLLKETVALPFTMNSETKSLVLNPSQGELWLDVCLLFPSDPLVDEFVLSSMGMYELAPDDLRLIGSISLHVCWKSELVLNFTASTTEMSILFAKSESIRETFINFLRENNGIEAYFDDENSDPIVIWPPTDAKYLPTNIYEQVERRNRRRGY